MILVPYTHAKLRPETVRSISDHVTEPVTWREIDPADRGGYHRILADAWRQPGDLIIIEHDIEIRAGVVESLTDCRQPWCGFPYAIGEQLLVCLGCTRFTADLKAALPGLLDDVAAIAGDGLPPMVWERLDVRLAGRLEAYGHRRHWHGPPVTHHHTYII